MTKIYTVAAVQEWIGNTISTTYPDGTVMIVHRVIHFESINSPPKAMLQVFGFDPKSQIVNYQAMLGAYFNNGPDPNLWSSGWIFTPVANLTKYLELLKDNWQGKLHFRLDDVHPEKNSVYLQHE